MEKRLSTDRAPARPPLLDVRQLDRTFTSRPLFASRELVGAKDVSFSADRGGVVTIAEAG